MVHKAGAACYLLPALHPLGPFSLLRKHRGKKAAPHLAAALRLNIFIDMFLIGSVAYHAPFRKGRVIPLSPEGSSRQRAI